MSFEADPVIGSWYRRGDRPQPFQVVAFDREEGSIDIEYFDGTLDEWPVDHWHALGIEPCEAPQDWTGPFDSIDGDAAPDTETTNAADALIEPIEAAQDERDRDLLEMQAADVAAAREPASTSAAAYRRPKGR